MSVYYVDTSAALKLLVDEEHSRAFAAFYDGNGDASWVSSALLRIELARTVARTWPALAPDARELLQAFDYISIDDDIADDAMGEPGRLRSLDAIHLATARVLGTDLTAIATYDVRLADAAKDAGMEVVAPADGD